MTKNILEKEAEHNNEREAGESKKYVRNTLPSQREEIALTLVSLGADCSRRKASSVGFRPGNLPHTGGMCRLLW